MSRVKKNILITSFILTSALAADLFLGAPLYAQSDEARELNRKGALAITDGRHGEAVQLLKQAMALEPKWGEPCYNAAKLLRILGKREDMIKMLRKANGVEPDNVTYAEEYLRVLNEELDKTTDSSEIKKLHEEILRVEPGNLKIGIISVRDQVKFDENIALDEAQKLIEKNSRLRSKYETKEMGELFYIIAKISYKRGELDKAKNNIDNAVKFDFDEKDEAKNLQKEIKKAVEDKIASLMADATEAQKIGEHDKAMAMLKEAESIQPENEAIKNAIIDFATEEDINKEITKAERLNANDRWLDAREILIKLTTTYPENAKAKKMLADMAGKEKALLNGTGLPDVPTKAIERKNITKNSIESGKRFFDAGNFKAAVGPLNKALALVNADKDLEGYREEIDNILKQIAISDENKENWIKAVEARNSGEYEDCLKLLKKLPRDYDEQYDSYMAEAYYKTGDIDKADEYAHSQLSKQKENNRAKFVLGSIYLEKGDNEAAHKYFQEIFDADPEYPELNDKLVASSTGKYGMNAAFIVVIVLLVWICVVMKRNMPIYIKNSKIGKAKSWFKREFYDECIQVLMEVRHLSILTPADNFEIAKLLAQCYLKKGTYDRAIGECKHLISMSPKSEEAHTWLGYAYLGRRMLAPEALPELLNLYKKDQKNIALVSLLGSYYAQQKNISDEGVEILEQWLNLEHDNVEVLKPLGKYYLKKNISNDKAMKVFQKMMEIGSPDPDFMLGVANVYLRANQFDNCLQLCEQVINADINNEYVHAILLDAYKKQNRLQELLDIYKNFLQNNPYNVAFQNGLQKAMAAYDKQQSRNAAQAAAQAAAVMEKMQQMSPAEDVPAEIGPGEFACPSCGKGNPNGAYICQHCGAQIA